MTSMAGQARDTSNRQEATASDGRERLRDCDREWLETDDVVRGTES